MIPELIALQFQFTHFVVNRNLEGISHEESCRTPQTGVLRRLSGRAGTIR